MSSSTTSPPLPPATHIGPVTLAVSDLTRSLAFYQDRLGFRVQERTNGRAVLGAGPCALLVLEEAPDARQAPGTGLFHVAILLPTRAALSQVFRHLIDTQTPLQGAADHFVSEALYLADPDGIGLELYRDRPRSAWTYRDGVLAIGTVALDTADLLAEPPAAGWTGLPDNTTVGHVHLHAADPAAAVSFYRATLGFDLVSRLGPMAFLSAGGYHHHIAVRPGRGRTPADALGLRSYTIVVPDDTAFAELRDRLGRAGTSGEAAFHVDDPSGNRVRVTPADSF